MRVLAIDTAVGDGSIALLVDGAVVAHRKLERTSSGKTLAPAVAELIRDHLPGGDPAAIDRIALSIGPGSFTGLRIGLAFVKGLALVHPRPVVPVSTLAAIAEGIRRSASSPRPVAVVLDARGGELYAALFSGSLAPDPRLPPGLYRKDEVAKALGEAGEILLGGDAAPMFDLGAASIAPRDQWVPDARIVGELADQGAEADAAALEPIYLQRTPVERKIAASDLVPKGEG